MVDRPLKILIADDHAVVRKGLAMVLRLEPGFQIVGEVGNGQEALELSGKVFPDIVLLDRIMPIMDGKSTAHALKNKYPEIKVIILTGTEPDSEVMEFLSAGVDGYLMKDVDPEELKNAIRIVAAGEAYLYPSVTTQVLKDLRRSHLPSTQLLTNREHEVLEWMAKGLTYREIANQLVIGEETVRSHAKNIMGKLNVSSRRAAVQEARRQGLLPDH
jgi:DNA-binding NarL/FixJ family response regulator